MLPLRHQSLKVHSRFELQYPSTRYSTAWEYGELVLGECGTSTKYHQIHEQRVPVRIGSATPPAGWVRFKSHFKLSTITRQAKIMIKNTCYSLQ